MKIKKLVVKEEFMHEESERKEKIAHILSVYKKGKVVMRTGGEEYEMCHLLPSEQRGRGSGR